MKKRTQYHPIIILKHQLGELEDHHYKFIPPSTLRNWKGKNLLNIYGFNTQEDQFENRLVKRVLGSNTIKAAGKALFFINDAFAKALQHHKFIYNNPEFRNRIITIIDKFGEAIPRKKLFQWAGIKHQQFYSWRRRSCKASVLDICRLRHVNQLSVKEVATIKSYLINYLPTLQTKAAVYSKMVREGAAYMSLRTFYNYSQLLGYTNRRIPKAKRKVGLRASRPKQILHMDVTVYKFQDNTKAYIYLIQDNFSRHILNWKISRVCNSTIALENLKEACQKYKLLEEENIDLIVDGGMENQGEVLKFLNNQSVIKLKTALKDIPHSNSMIESANLQLKYYYLFPRGIIDYDTLLIEMPKIIYAREYERYRHYLGFRTPFETFKGVDIGMPEIDSNFKTAAVNRKIYNRRFACERYCR